MTTTSPATPKKKTYIIQDGQRVGYTLDKDGDGNPDVQITYVTDQDSQRIGDLVDRDLDGTDDRRITYTFNDDGKRNGQTKDRDLDGTDDHRIGQIVDKGNDGVADTVTCERAAMGIRLTCRMA